MIQPGTHHTWIAQVLDHLDSDPQHPALISVEPDDTRTWSRGQLSRMVGGGIDLLDACGAPAGQPVPALLSTRASAIALLVGAAASRRPLAPLAPRMTERELLGCLENLPGDLLLTEPEWVPTATSLARTAGRRVIVVDEQLEGDGTGGDPIATDDVALVMHTSGTTGQPKRVDARQGALLARGRVNAALVGLDPGARFVTAALFHHVGGLGNIAVALAAGATLVTFPAFSVAAWQQLGTVAPTHTVLVPTIIEMLLEADALRLPSLRTIAYGASPIHPDTMRRVQEVVPTAEFVNLFGQTEGSPITVLDALDHRRAASERPDLLRSVGRAAPGVELRLDDVDEHGVGELWARMAHSFVHDADGWQHTGDLASIDPDGYVFLAGRRGDKIIRGGENVFPLEVEQLLESHPDIREAAVIGVPDRRLGESVLALLVPEPGTEPDPEELRAFLRARLAGFKVPTAWRRVESLPRNVNGKVVRASLARLAAADES